MKKLRWCVLACAVLSLSVAPLRAQITVDVQPDQDQYLPGEAVNVAVRISNTSGQSLPLGADPDWLQFSVESKNGFLVSELKDLPVAGEFVLDSSKAATKRVDIAPGFELSRPGLYSVGATIKVKTWGQEFTAKPKPFSIVQGAKLWEQNFGLPPSADRPNESPEVRKYALQQANYLKQLKLYVRITDADEGRIIRVFPAGQMVSFSRPEPQVDKNSNLHVLWQTGARTFAYRIINPDGEILGRQTHMYTGTRPRLTLTKEGQIIVQGGARQPSRDDLPPGASPVVAPPSPAPAPPAGIDVNPPVNPSNPWPR